MTHNVNTAHWAIIQIAMEPIRWTAFLFIAFDVAFVVYLAILLKGNQIIRFESNELLCFFFLVEVHH